MDAEWIKNWTSNIRNHCDLIDRQVELSLQPSQSDEQLKYILMRLEKLESKLHLFLVAPGKGKSYQSLVNTTESEISRLRREIKVWQTDNLKPEFYKETK